MSQKNNTVELQQEIAAKLKNSDLWLVLRADNEGVHAHMPNEDHLVLFSLFFKGNPEFLQAINSMVFK